MDKTVLAKKIENYWYYYKIHTIVVIFVIVALAILIHQCATTVQPDLTIIIATQNAVLTESQENSLENYLSSFTEDVNKDGKKNVQVSAYFFNNPNTADAMQEAFTANLAVDTNIIVIMDDSTYENMTKGNPGENFTDFDSVIPGEKLVNQYQLPVSDTRLAGQSFAQGLDNLNISLLDYNKSDKDASYIADIKNSDSFIKKITIK